MKKDIKLLIESIFDDDIVDLGLKDEHDITDKVIDYVDLGLPSGTKWCKYNVGAKTETDYGNYYQWGETNDNVIGQHSIASFNGDVIERVDVEYVKYNERDELTLLLPEDDIAYQTSNGLYRMPTFEQCEELISNTNIEWVENYKDSDVNGYVFRSKVNDNYIFIPAAGYFLKKSVCKRDEECRVWCSNLGHGSSSYAVCMCLDDSGIFETNFFYIRSNYNSVRGVLNKNN